MLRISRYRGKISMAKHRALVRYHRCFQSIDALDAIYTPLIYVNVKTREPRGLGFIYRT